MSKKRTASGRPGGRGDHGTAGKRPATSKTRFVVSIALVLVLVGAVAALTISMPEEVLPQPVAQTQPASTPGPWEYDPVTDRHWHPEHGHWHDGPPPSTTAVTGDGVAVPPGVTNPSPWQYDAATDRHYDPGHGHWHAGPPPDGVDENTLVSPVRSDRVDPPPGIANPAPWQYDEASNKHYHPGHRHWHAGPPPDPANR